METITMIRTETLSLQARDPLVVRADMLVRTAERLGAVVDGIMLDLGILDEALLLSIADASHLEVRADHHDGGVVSRRVPIVHH